MERNIWGHLVEFVLACIKGLENNSEAFSYLSKDIEQFQNQQALKMELPKSERKRSFS